MNRLLIRPYWQLIPRSLPRLTQGRFIACLVVLAALAGTTRGSGFETDGFQLLLGLKQNKVLWLCVGIAVWHMFQDRDMPVQWQVLLAALPTVVTSAVSQGVIVWSGLCVTLALLGLQCGSLEYKVGSRIAFAAALQSILTDVLSQLGGDYLLHQETRLAGFLIQNFVGEVFVAGTALVGSEGHTLVLVWGCSSFSNLGHALLLFWALASIRNPILASRRGRISLLAYMALVAGLTVVLNLTRISLMAIDPAWYELLHAGAGASVFRASTLAMAATLGLAAFHHE